ncbi:MAG: hypothetical protein D6679_01430 [Candidatus Hydrogenedentota bacterium]|nr:MAG: hypothetical protein D6679_01430 [Candidatus Hydrogenedentota bacterium]
MTAHFVRRFTNWRCLNFEVLDAFRNLAFRFPAASPVIGETEKGEIGKRKRRRVREGWRYG